MNKKQILLSCLFVGLMFLITNSLAVTIGIAISLVTYFLLNLRKQKKQVKNNNDKLFKFFTKFNEEYSKENTNIINVCYKEIETDINESYILPIDENNEDELLEQLKNYFNSRWFEDFVCLYKQTGITFSMKQNRLKALIESFNGFNQKKEIDSKQLSDIKLLLIAVSCMALSRVVFNEYYQIFVGCLGGYLVAIMVGIISTLTYQFVLCNDRKEIEE